MRIWWEVMVGEEFYYEIYWREGGDVRINGWD